MVLGGCRSFLLLVTTGNRALTANLMHHLSAAVDEQGSVSF